MVWGGGGGGGGGQSTRQRRSLDCQVFNVQMGEFKLNSELKNY